MSSTHAKELLSKLKTSLPNLPAKAKHDRPAEAGPPEGEPKAGARAAKLSVSLYDLDLVRMDAIKGFMGQKGYRNISDSEALRLACRAAEIGDGLVDIYREMRREDGRRRKKSSSVAA